MRQLFQNMLEMQDQLNNETICYTWRTDNGGENFCRAIWAECAELLELLPWKWWKNTGAAPSREPILIELVDIWHFGMSELLRTKHKDRYDMLTDYLLAIHSAPRDTDNAPLDVLDFLVGKAGEHLFSPLAFFDLVAAFGFTLEDIYRGYVGKNVLNKFRQDNGYKQGTYIKIWNGQEDNFTMLELVASLDVGENAEPLELLQKRIYDDLFTVYSAVSKGNANATAAEKMVASLKQTAAVAEGSATENKG